MTSHDSDNQKSILMKYAGISGGPTSPSSPGTNPSLRDTGRSSKYLIVITSNLRHQTLSLS